MTRAARLVRLAGLDLAALFALVVLCCAASAVLPSRGVLTLAGTMAWAIYGPHLVLAAAVATAISAAAAIRRPTRPATVIVAGALVALASASAITGAVAAAAPLGSVDPLAALAVSGSAPSGPDVVETYTVADGQPLRALVDRPPPARRAAPVLVYIHGGGWVSGSAEQFLDARWYARRGWLVVSVDYRLATSGAPTWDRAPADVGCALAWTAARAADLGGDPLRVVVMGDSAGGNLAVNLGWAAASGRAPSDCPQLGAVPVPAAVVAAYPVINPESAYRNGRPWLSGEDPRRVIERYIGGAPAAHPDRLTAISSSTYASPRAPRTLVVEPERDDFIPADGVDEAVRQARAAGVPVTLVTVPFAHHAFDAVLGSLGDQVKRGIVTRYLRDAGLAPDG